MRYYYKQISIISLCLWLGACGFHLRGAQEIPPQLQRLAIQAPNPYDPLVLRLKQILQANKVKLEDSRQAPLTLQVVNAQLNQQLANISSNTQVRTYNLQYTVTFQLVNRQNQRLYGPQTVTVSSSYTASENQVLGDDSVLDMQKQNMIREAIDLMLLRLGSEDVKAILQKNQR